MGKDVLKKVTVQNHDAFSSTGVVHVGDNQAGYPVYLNKTWVEADKRIVMGFIEPHFMAGFSGGYKGVFPGVAGIDSIMRYHRAEAIGHPGSTWGQLEENPTQAQIRENAGKVPIDFLVNVTLNRSHEITGFFCGDPLEAHVEGCAFAKKTAMRPVPTPFDIVITSNSGFPLDQNLYQSVKGMSAAAQIVKPGGFIGVAARCNDGFPSHGEFKTMLEEGESPKALLDMIMTPGFARADQWQVQLFCQIALKARIGVFSEIAADALEKVHLEPVADMNARLQQEIARTPNARIAVLPEGPMTIPYLA